MAIEYKAIDQLPKAGPLGSDDLMVVLQDGKAMQLPASSLKGADGAAGKDGANGKDGLAGKDGADGFSPTVSVTKSGKVTTVTFVDKNGGHTATINDGADGQDGAGGSGGGEAYLAGAGVRITDAEAGKTISVERPTVPLTQAEYDALSDAEKDADVLYLILDGYGGLPTVSAADNGKLLGVVDGAYGLITLLDVSQEGM